MAGGPYNVERLTQFGQTRVAGGFMSFRAAAAAIRGIVVEWRTAGHYTAAGEMRRGLRGQVYTHGVNTSVRVYGIGHGRRTLAYELRRHGYRRSLVVVQIDGAAPLTWPPVDVVEMGAQRDAYLDRLAAWHAAQLTPVVVGT